MEDHADLIEHLRALGIESGDLLLVHSALSGMACRPETLLDALLEVIGPEGTLLVPTFTPSFRHDSPDGTFDLDRTPSSVGYLTELVRTRADAVRNLDPIHSFAAIGGRADEFGRLHARNSYDPNNVLGRLHVADAKIMAVGLDPFGRSMTFFHYVEQREGVERRGWTYRHEKAFPGTIVVRDKAFSAEYAIHVQNFEDGVTYDFAPIGEELDRRGVMHAGTFVDKLFTWGRASDMYEVAGDVIVDEPDQIYAVDA